MKYVTKRKYNYSTYNNTKTTYNNRLKNQNMKKCQREICHELHQDDKNLWFLILREKGIREMERLSEYSGGKRIHQQTMRITATKMNILEHV